MPHLRNEFRPLNRFTRCGLTEVDPPERTPELMAMMHSMRVEAMTDYYSDKLEFSGRIYKPNPVVVDGMEYSSLNEAARRTGFDCEAIARTANGSRHQKFTAHWLEHGSVTLQEAPERSR